MNRTRRVATTAMFLMLSMVFSSCSRGKTSPAVPADPQPRTGRTPENPPPQPAAPDLLLTARFRHQTRRAMIGQFTNSYSNQSVVNLQFGPGDRVTLSDQGESTDRVVHQKPFVCNTEAETRTWTVERTGTWTSEKTTRTLTLKIIKNDCRTVKTCDNRPPENLPCDALPEVLTLTCTEGVVPVGDAKEPAPALSCTAPDRGSHTGLPWVFGRDACFERVTDARGPFHYEHCAKTTP